MVTCSGQTVPAGTLLPSSVITMVCAVSVYRTCTGSLQARTWAERYTRLRFLSTPVNVQGRDSATGPAPVDVSTGSCGTSSAAAGLDGPDELDGMGELEGTGEDGTAET